MAAAIVVVGLFVVVVVVAAYKTLTTFAAGALFTGRTQGDPRHTATSACSCKNGIVYEIRICRRCSTVLIKLKQSS